MCNRYTPSRWDDPVFAALGRAVVNFPPDHIAKIGLFGTGGFIRCRADGQFEGIVGQWGMIRPGSKVRKPSPKQARAILTNNARSETIAEKPTYRESWSNGQRCIIPAWQFDEPCYETGPKNVWWEFRRADGTPWGIAGIWSEWTDPETGEVVPSYSMPTVNADAHPLLSRMHKPDPQLPPNKRDKRSIVPLQPSDWMQWMLGSVDDARSLLRVPPEDVFDAGPEHRNGGFLV